MGLFSCCCKKTPCSLSSSIGQIGLAVFMDQRGNLPYACHLYKRINVVVKDTLDNSFVGSYTLRGSVNFGSGFALVKIEDIVGGGPFPAPAGHGYFQSFRDWTFSDETPLDGSEVSAAALSLAQMIDWSTAPSPSQTIWTMDQFGNVTSRVNTNPPQPGPINFQLAAQSVRVRDYTSHNFINPEAFAGWMKLPYGSQYGNLASSWWNATIQLGKATFPGAWCKKTQLFTISPGSGGGPNYCGIGTTRIAGTPVPENQLNGGTFLFVPGAPNHDTSVQCSPC